MDEICPVQSFIQSDFVLKRKNPWITTYFDQN